MPLSLAASRAGHDVLALLPSASAPPAGHRGPGRGARLPPRTRRAHLSSAADCWAAWHAASGEQGSVAGALTRAASSRVRRAPEDGDWAASKRPLHSHTSAQPVLRPKGLLLPVLSRLGSSRQWQRVSVRQAPAVRRVAAVAPLAQEGRSEVEGGSREALVAAEQSAEAGEPSQEDGVVIIAVRECADGSVIFDFGDPEQRPEQDPLDAFVRGSSGEEKSGKERSGEEKSGEEKSGQSLGAPEREESSEGTAGQLVVAEEGARELEAADESASVPEKSSGPSFRLNSGGAQLPHPAKVQKGGEDAFFCTNTEQASYVGVSDGVGGWATLGIDPGMYSRELMGHCERMVEENILPKSMLVRAHKMTKATGSATAMVARLQENRLRVANLGDSGFLLLRNGQVALASTQMQHAFNFPFQIGSKGGDDPNVAKDYDLEVELGDLLILGTDGLLDNLFEKEIVEAALLLRSKGLTPEVASQQIAAFAQQRSLLKVGLSPFAVQADAAGYKHMGGKPDDITVVLAYVE